MMWKVKKGLFKYKIYDMDNLVAARINIKSGCSYIANADDENVLRICENSPLCLTVSGRAGDGTADIGLAKTDSLVRPPRAEQLCLRWNGTELIIKQLENRDFHICRAGKLIGKVTGMLNRTAFIEIEDEATPELAALLFVLSNRMLHEDDIYIV